MKKADKPLYCPLPIRAAGDRTLTAEGLRVLATIAAHDRLSANGIGCYAGHQRIAELASCEFHSLSRTIRALVAAGYLETGQHPLNKRLRVYRVVYNEFDASYFQQAKGPKVSKAANGMVSNAALETGPMVSKPIPETVHYQEDGSVNIFSETGIHPVETVNTFGETTSPPRQRALEKVSGISVSAMLAMLERSINAAPDKVDLAYWTRHLDHLAGLDATLTYDDPNYHRAQRLLGRLDEIAAGGRAA